MERTRKKLKELHPPEFDMFFSTVASGLLSTNVDEIPIAEGRSGYSYQDFRDSFRCQETEEALVEANLRPMPMWKIYRGHKKTSLGT